MREFIQQQPNIPLSQPGGGSEKKPWNPFARLVSVVTTLLILSGILYGGALLLSRAAGFSEIVRGRLDKHTGLNFKIGGSSLTPSLALVLTGVEAKSPGHPLGAGVSAERVVIRWSLARSLFGGDVLRELYAEGVDLHFGLDAAGRWQPAQFGQISRWMAARLQLDLSRYTNLAERAAVETKPVEELDLFGEERVQMKDALVHWQVVAGSEIARADGVVLTSTAMEAPNRKFSHILFSFSRADTAQGYSATARSMELFELDDRQFWIAGAPTNFPVAPRAPVIRPPEPRKISAPPPATTPPLRTPSVEGDPFPEE